MSRRVRVNDVIRVTGLSRATVDRALNGRDGIHPETQRIVREAYKSLAVQNRDTYPSARPLPPAQDAADIDAVIRFGRGLTKQILIERDLQAPGLEVFDMHELSGDEVLSFVQRLCENVSRPLIIGAKNDDRLADALAAARRRGKRIITLVSDLSPQARDVHVGIDNRKAGQAAALLVGHGLKHKAAKVAVMLGDNAFRGHEDREIGFRTHLRSAFPHIVLTDAVKGDDSVEMTYEAASSLLKEHGDIGAIYNVGGGNQGLANALREADLTERAIVVTHETNHITVPLIRDGTIDFAIAQSAASLLASSLKMAHSQDSAALGEYHLVDFTIHTKFNVPSL